MQVFLRPGVELSSGWAWLVGLPPQLTEAVRRGVAMERKRSAAALPHSSFAAALEATLALACAECGSLGADDDADDARGAGGVLATQGSVLDGLRMLDASMRVERARAGWAEAAYWHSVKLLHAVEPSCDARGDGDADGDRDAGRAADGGSGRSDGSCGGASNGGSDSHCGDDGSGGAGGQGVRCGPTILIGDAACGRPFWLGSTLNGHLADVATLVFGSGPHGGPDCWRAWDWDADGATPLRPYLERMRLRTLRTERKK